MQPSGETTGFGSVSSVPSSTGSDDLLLHERTIVAATRIASGNTYVFMTLFYDKQFIIACIGIPDIFISEGSAVLRTVRQERVCKKEVKGSLV